MHYMIVTFKLGKYQHVAGARRRREKLRNGF